ncbi:MAG: DUF4192 domain-containing protein, partial [Nocardiopsaceae bacterium]|nr:DUF4192 domain-containing protein [Nocardiopsaceae bacterium]
MPRLLTFQPARSLVLIGTAPPGGQVRLTLRYDLPDPPDPETAGEIARHATSVLAAQDIAAAAGVGYGPGPLVTPVADALRERAAVTGLAITELLRAENNRYWSYLCADPACCPAEGTAYDPGDPEAWAEAGAVSGTTVLASREELAATVAPVTGADAELMRQATRRAEERAARLPGGPAGSEGPADSGRPAGSASRGPARRLVAAAGVEAVTEAIDACRRGDRVPAGDRAAWLTVLLGDQYVRDDAWCRMDPDRREDHLRLWTDLTRLAQPGYVAAPASLLAFTAWQCGNGALANVALDRALGDDPGYRMAQLLRQAIDSGAPPSLARIPMTPEEVAASYEETFDQEK